ncbi:MAG: 3',5'-cyclic-AMP phosphodiesterase [Ectothiorhodospiraceae bacterium]|nr:3',5'-cyclic-AMP phosphodiesterase [Ectothiorhodospiraceae bacterium]
MEHNRAGAPLRVLHMTDTHLFGDPTVTLAGVATDRTCLDVLEHVRAHAGHLDLILLTGDLVHDRSMDAYLRLRERMLAFQVPVRVIPGNHDDQRLMRELFDAPPVQWGFQFRMGDWLLVTLDSSIPGKPGGRLQDEELERLDTLLGQEPGRHALICLHHQPVPMGSEWLDRSGVENAAALLEIIGRHASVRAVLWGHVHQDSERRQGQVRMLSTPSTCIQFRPGQAGFSLDALPPGYRVLELHGDGRVDSRLYRLPATPQGLELGTEGY